jgi:hypothetical protein
MKTMAALYILMVTLIALNGCATWEGKTTSSPDPKVGGYIDMGVGTHF